PRYAPVRTACTASPTFASTSRRRAASRARSSPVRSRARRRDRASHARCAALRSRRSPDRRSRSSTRFACERRHRRRAACSDESMTAQQHGATSMTDDEAHFRLLVESVRDYAIFELDPKGFVTTWNAGAERIKGYKASEIIGRHFSCFYPKED